MDKELIKRLHGAGFTVIPLNSGYVPMFEWKKVRQEGIASADLSAFFDKEGFSYVGFATMCSRRKAYCIDVDLKYEHPRMPVGQSVLWPRIWEVLFAILGPDICSRLYIEQTRSGGYHVVFSINTETVEDYPTVSFAKRYALPEELRPNEIEYLNKGSKTTFTRTMIESRGFDGLVYVYPSPGYAVVQGSMLDLPVITEEQFNSLEQGLRTFNEIPMEISDDNAKVGNMVKKVAVLGDSGGTEVKPWDEFSEKVSCQEVLGMAGWKESSRKGHEIRMVRPGNTANRHSGYVHTETNVFVNMSESVPLDVNKGYRSFSLLVKLVFHDDVKAAIEYLRERGFIKPFEKKAPVTPQTRLESKIEESNPVESSVFMIQEKTLESFIGSIEEVDDYINRRLSGTLEMGRKTGFPSVDVNLRLKNNQFNIVHGVPGSGKSQWSWHLMLVEALFYGYKGVIATQENRFQSVFVWMIQALLGRKIESCSRAEIDNAKQWIHANFAFIVNKYSYSYREIIDIYQNLRSKSGYSKLLVDPYNSLEFDESLAKKIRSLMGTGHDYHYAVTHEFRKLSSQGNTVYLNCHTGTEGARAVGKDPRKPPSMYHIEGGMKFGARADDFSTIHRNTKDPMSSAILEIHVEKVKDYETGGKPTFSEAPLLLKYYPEFCRYKSNDSVGNYNYDPVEQFLLHGAKSLDYIIPNRKPVSDQNYGSVNSPAMKEVTQQNYLHSQPNGYVDEDSDDLPF